MQPATSSLCKVETMNASTWRRRQTIPSHPIHPSIHPFIGHLLSLSLVGVFVGGPINGCAKRPIQTQQPLRVPSMFRLSVRRGRPASLWCRTSCRTLGFGKHCILPSRRSHPSNYLHFKWSNYRVPLIRSYYFEDFVIDLYENSGVDNHGRGLSLHHRATHHDSSYIQNNN